MSVLEHASAGRETFELSADVSACLSRSDTKRGQTQRIVLALLQEHYHDDALPTSGRFVFYELEQRGLATKPSPNDVRTNKRRSIGWPPGSQDVGEALTFLREAGLIPWGWITDETRTLAAWDYAATVGDYVRARLEEARINPWGEQAPPLILCESRAMAGVLRRVASEYLCPITGTAGQCGGFLRTVVSQYVREDERTVLYLGDLDRCGEDIEWNTRRVLETCAGRPLDWRRIGLTHEQVAEREIAPIWKVDGRDKSGHYAWEVEALGQAPVVELVRSTLAELLPEPLERVLERERREIRSADEFLAAWRPE